jgi:hypothetical protein
MIKNQLTEPSLATINAALLAEKARFMNGGNGWVFVFPGSFKGPHQDRQSA